MIHIYESIKSARILHAVDKNCTKMKCVVNVQGSRLTLASSFQAGSQRLHTTSTYKRQS